MRKRNRMPSRRDYPGRCFNLADRVSLLAEEIRQANKAADLHYPQYSLVDLSIHINEIKYEWLENTLKLNPNERGRWPHL